MLPSIDSQPYVAFWLPARVRVDHECRHLPGAVFGLLAHACAEDLGRHPQHPARPGRRGGRNLFWATKSLFSGAAILIVITGMGLTNARWPCGRCPPSCSPASLSRRSA